MTADPLTAPLALLAQDPAAGGLLVPDLLIKIVGGLLSAGTVASAAWLLAGRTYRSKLRLLRQKADHYEDLHADAAAERDRQAVLASKYQQEYADASARLTELTGRYGVVLKAGAGWQAEATKLKAEHKGWQAEVARLRAAVEELTAAKLRLESELAQRSSESADRQAAIGRTERRMRRALKLEGQLWAAKALQGRPRFRELTRRRRAIVSVLNLKGGVGKTTITAHLGAALARRGYRVLVIDLDLQGSLTTLLLPQDKVSQLFAGGRLLQHFFAKAADDRTAKITPFAQPVFELPETGGSLSVVGTTDALAYAELNLTMRWLLQSGARDTRFLLRRALHLLGAGRRYDIVLLDCPPVVNVSCVNALAASDYLLVPTTLTRKSLERVPVLLGRVLKSEKFRRYVNHDLKVLGLVANRTWRDDLTDAERDDWDRLATQCRDVYGHAVKRFETVVPQQGKAIRDSEADFEPPDPDGRLAGIFARLAEEIEKELPSECRRLAKAPR